MPESDQDRSLRADAMLVRIDERTQHMQRQINRMEDSFVTKVEFRPVRLAVYGAIALLLTLLLTAVFGDPRASGGGSIPEPQSAPPIVQTVEPTPPPLSLARRGVHLPAL